LPLSLAELVIGSFWMWKGPKLNSKTHIQCFNTWHKCGRCMQKHETYAKVDSEPSRLTRLQRHLVTTPYSTPCTPFVFAFLLNPKLQRFQARLPTLCCVSNTHLDTCTQEFLLCFFFLFMLLWAWGSRGCCLGCWEHTLLFRVQHIIISNKGAQRKICSLCHSWVFFSKHTTTKLMNLSFFSSCCFVG